ncbi:torsin-1A-interacting protein 2 isoform X2 [Parambassis ranga]|uniref:Torsin-1A-interacting protein 2 isoform X2 n=1 Tax=Parambassis ranga TaxID=210632 RepID=A0A6P7IFH0_9TELE|nr:torsin-1A-interacting protein 2-like isoform X2 [Parambassis ranga]
MDSMVHENKSSRPLRRSTRHASVKVLSLEPTPRGPLKRTKKGSEKKASGAAVNGTKDAENDTEDDGESPSKKSRLNPGGSNDGRGDENEMDVQESVEDMEMEKNEELEMEIHKESSHVTSLPKIHQDTLGDVSLSPCVVLGERYRIRRTVNDDQDVAKLTQEQPATNFPAAATKSTAQIRSPADRHEALNTRIPSMAEYRRTMELKTKSTEIPSVNRRVPSMYAASEKSYTMRKHVNNIPTQKETVHHKKQEATKKTGVTKTSSQKSSSGCMWYVWHLALLVLFSSAILLVYKLIPVLQRKAGVGGHASRAVKLETFANNLSLLETQFPTQRPELWRRSKVHLEKHLKTAQPTEPVSLILTAGLKAERTMECLAQALASSFSSTLNASALHIDGASKANMDSDEVKLDIDRQLKAAFEGEKPVAVIHRFEELPPGSTLIFYRYCDHENAAYKQVFLLFTVLLPQDAISSDLSLKEVEEIVQDYVKERLVSSSSQATFNDMDINKFGGLWSRISHLILPVVSEEEVEKKGC